MINPLNDLAKIRLDDQDEYGFGGVPEDKAESGILVEIPDFSHYGFYSFAFENSLMDDDYKKDLAKYWTQFIGKRVYWLALSEKGAILKEEDGQRYAFVKFTSLIAFSEPGKKAKSVLDQHGGSFSA